MKKKERERRQKKEMSDFVLHSSGRTVPSESELDETLLARSSQTSRWVVDRAIATATHESSSISDPVPLICRFSRRRRRQKQLDTENMSRAQQRLVVAGGKQVVFLPKQRDGFAT